jgi:hypothetical protein
MPVGARSLIFRYVAIDSDTDISADVIELSLDQVVWVTATHASPSAGAQAAYLVANPLQFGARYWVRVLTGPGQTLIPPYGHSILHGRITDNPEIPYIAWSLDIPTD